MNKNLTLALLVSISAFQSKADWGWKHTLGATTIAAAAGAYCWFNTPNWLKSDARLVADAERSYDQSNQETSGAVKTYLAINAKRAAAKKAGNCDDALITETREFGKKRKLGFWEQFSSQYNYLSHDAQKFAPILYGTDGLERDSHRATENLSYLQYRFGSENAARNKFANYNNVSTLASNLHLAAGYIRKTNQYASSEDQYKQHLASKERDEKLRVEQARLARAQEQTNAQLAQMANQPRVHIDYRVIPAARVAPAAAGRSVPAAPGGPAAV